MISLTSVKMVDFGHASAKCLQNQRHVQGCLNQGSREKNISDPGVVTG